MQFPAAAAAIGKPILAGILKQALLDTARQVLMQYTIGRIVSGLAAPQGLPPEEQAAFESQRQAMANYDENLSRLYGLVQALPEGAELRSRIFFRLRRGGAAEPRLATLFEGPAIVSRFIEAAREASSAVQSTVAVQNKIRMLAKRLLHELSNVRTMDEAEDVLQRLASQTELLSQGLLNDFGTTASIADLNADPMNRNAPYQPSLIAMPSDQETLNALTGMTQVFSREAQAAEREVAIELKAALIREQALRAEAQLAQERLRIDLERREERVALADRIAANAAATAEQAEQRRAAAEEGRFERETKLRAQSIELAELRQSVEELRAERDAKLEEFAGLARSMRVEQNLKATARGEAERSQTALAEKARELETAKQELMARERLIRDLEARLSVPPSATPKPSARYELFFYAPTPSPAPVLIGDDAQELADRLAEDIKTGETIQRAVDMQGRTYDAEQSASAEDEAAYAQAVGFLRPPEEESFVFGALRALGEGIVTGTGRVVGGAARELGQLGVQAAGLAAQGAREFSYAAAGAAAMLYDVSKEAFEERLAAFDKSEQEKRRLQEENRRQLQELLSKDKGNAELRAQLAELQKSMAEQAEQSAASRKSLLAELNAARQSFAEESRKRKQMEEDQLRLQPPFPTPAPKRPRTVTVTQTVTKTVTQSLQPTATPAPPAAPEALSDASYADTEALGFTYAPPTPFPEQRAQLRIGAPSAMLSGMRGASGATLSIIPLPSATPTPSATATDGFGRPERFSREEQELYRNWESRRAVAIQARDFQELRRIDQEERELYPETFRDWQDFDRRLARATTPQARAAVEERLRADYPDIWRAILRDWDAIAADEAPPRDPRRGAEDLMPPPRSRNLARIIDPEIEAEHDRRDRDMLGNEDYQLLQSYAEQDQLPMLEDDAGSKLQPPKLQLPAGILSSPGEGIPMSPASLADEGSRGPQLRTSGSGGPPSGPGPGAPQPGPPGPQPDARIPLAQPPRVAQRAQQRFQFSQVMYEDPERQRLRFSSSTDIMEARDYYSQPLLNVAVRQPLQPGWPILIEGAPYGDWKYEDKTPTFNT